MSYLPQDSRAPNRQQRWIELKNVGATEIPPHGVCEVAGSERDATSNATILQVKRPTADGLLNVVVNGGLPIPAGKSAKVGTNDYPAWVLYDEGDGTPDSGAIWGTVEDSFAIGKGKQGFLIAGDGHSAANLGFVVRVFRSPGVVSEMIRFEIVSVDLEEMTALVNITARTCPLTVVTQEVDGQVTVHDPCECFLDESAEALVGRCGTAVFMLPDGDEECQWEIWHLCCP